MSLSGHTNYLDLKLKDVLLTGRAVLSRSFSKLCKRLLWHAWLFYFNALPQKPSTGMGQLTAQSSRAQDGNVDRPLLLPFPRGQTKQASPRRTLCRACQAVRRRSGRCVSLATPPPALFGESECSRSGEAKAMFDLRLSSLIACDTVTDISIRRGAAAHVCFSQGVQGRSDSKAITWGKTIP